MATIAVDFDGVIHAYWPEWAETLTIQTAWQHQGQEAAA